MWRQEDAHRNSLNSHCYWALRKEGIGQRQATAMLEGKSVSFKNELYNPATKENVQTTRKELAVDCELMLGREYGERVAAFANKE